QCGRRAAGWFQEWCGGRVGDIGDGCISCGLVFFFSSRRRHTRLVSDWSSDVCSSDLGVADEDENSTAPDPSDSPPQVIEGLRDEIGRASCRERVSISGVAASLQKKDSGKRESTWLMCCVTRRSTVTLDYRRSRRRQQQ